MWTPQTYHVTLAIMVLSMICWGSWDNTQKIARGWRFELFYWDYIWGIMACALIFAFTLGRTQPGSPEAFLRNISGAEGHALGEAFAGGVIFNLGNLLLVAAISIAGMSVAFPIGSGLALVIGGALNYAIHPAGNPYLLFGGILLICAAIFTDAMAYRERESGRAAGKKGIALSVVCGVILGLFYPFVAKAMSGPGRVGPYAVCVVFCAGALISNFAFNYALMRRPVSGPPLRWGDYARGRFSDHTWGILGGLIWGVGTVSSYVAASVPLVGPATSFSMSQGNTMISALWGVFAWHEFRGASRGVKRLLALMFLLFVLGLAAIALAPIIG